MKDFDEWNEVKKNINLRQKQQPFKRGEIWWVSIGQNIGTESFGKGRFFRRPVLILKKLNRQSCIALPLTSSKKDGTWFIDITFRSEIRYVLLHQIKMIHINRFQRRIASLDENDFLRVKEKLKHLLELS